MKRRRSLAIVNPQGRLDVFLYRMADRGMQQLEQEYGLMCLREQLLPVIESLILTHVPAQNLIPREIRELLAHCERNRVKAGGGAA